MIKKQAHAYLESWAAFETMNHIEHAFEMAQKL